MHVNGRETYEPGEVNPESGRFCLNANLRKACRVLSNLYSEEMRSSDLQGTQFTLLSSIAGFGKVTIGELGHFLTMDQTTVTRGVQLLKKAGYLRVVPGEDRRTRVAELTEKGREVLNTTYPLWLKAQKSVWERLGEEKALQLLELSREIAALEPEV